MNKESLLIYSHGGGRLGNQLLVFSNLLSWYWENQHNNVKLFNLSFWDYSELFVSTQNNAICYFSKEEESALNILQLLKNRPLQTKRLQSYVRFPIIQLCRWKLLFPSMDVGFEKVLEIDKPDFIESLHAQKTLLLSGWQIRCWDLLKKYQDDLRDFFTPLPVYSTPAMDFIRPLKEKYDLVIGIYIRQGDYKDYLNGRFYFESKKYAEWMAEIYDHFSDQKVCFVIATNDHQDLSLFAPFPCYYATGNINFNGHYMENIIELANCDYILSAPSTFSTWAAFIGNKVIIPVVSENDSIRIENSFKNHLFDAIKDPEFSLAVK